MRKKFVIKSTYRTKETESYRYNIKDNNSDIRSINIGSDLINGAGLISNGGNSYLYNNRNSNFLYKQKSTESEEKQKLFLQNIVKKYLFIK